MNSRKSPIQRHARKVSQDGAASYRVSIEPVSNFLHVRQFIYPIVKPWSWIKKAKESLQIVDPKNVLIAKQISGVNLGVLFGLCLNGNTDNIRYLSSGDLDIWQMKEKDILKYGKENLIKSVGLSEKQGPIFTETQTGIYYSNRLKNLTASLLAVPEVFKMMIFKTTQSYSHVVMCPTTDVMFISHSHDTRGLCLIAEICQRYAKREPLMQTKPIRILKGNLSHYEASIVRNESNWPTNEDQIKTYKKSIIKRTRKQSCAKLSDS